MEFKCGCTFIKQRKKKEESSELINYHGDRWLDYLNGFLEELHYSKTKKLHDEWKKIVNAHRQNPNKAAGVGLS